MWKCGTFRYSEVQSVETLYNPLFELLHIAAIKG